MRTLPRTRQRFAPPGRRSVARALAAAIGGDLSQPAVIHSVAGSDSCYTVVATYCEVGISQKEAVESAPEDDLHVHSDPFAASESTAEAWSSLMPP